MLAIGHTHISEEIFSEHFVCDLAACKGACCVQGESGAPLEPEEVLLIEENLDAIKPFLNAEGLAALDKKGLSQTDSDGDLVTPLIGKHGACAFAVFDQAGIAKCGIEKSFAAGKSTFRKPVSCHLYPIRLQKIHEGIGVNYHRWPICAPACSCGAKLKVPVFRFLKESLIRKFGQEWFAELEIAFVCWQKTATI